MNLTALKSPSYRRYLIGSAAAVNGLWILRVVVTWIAWETSLSATFVGLIAALTMLPTMIIGPLFGAIMDRSNIIRAAYATNIGMIIAALIAIISLLLNIISPFFLILLALYIGVITAAHHPMRLSLGPRLVQKDQISSVSALAALNFNTARVISPFIAGIIIDNFGTLYALLTAIILYLPNIIIYSTLHPRVLKISKEYQSISAAIKEGFRFVWASEYLRLIFAISATYTISIRSVAEILPVIADGTFSNGASGLGHLAATVGAGSLCAALYKALGTSERVPAFSISIIIVTIFGMISAWILTITQLWPLALVSAACMGFAATYLGVSFQAEIQADLHDNIRGRVMSLWGMITLGSMSGFRFVWASEYLRLIFAISATYTISIRSVAEILPVIADGTFSNGASGLGHLAATVGAGSLCAALYKALGTSERVPAFSISIIIVTIFGMISAWILTITQLWPLALVSAACMGFAATYLGVSFQAEIQADLHDNIRGRVMSLWGMITLGSMSLGSLLIGWVADTLGMFFAGSSLLLCSLISLLYIYFNSKRFRL